MSVPVVIPGKIPPGFKPIPPIDGGCCFGCGPANPRGLQLRFSTDGESLLSEVTFSREFAGWSRVAHGGLQATVLDEIMGWTAILLLKRVVLTRTLTIRYLTPVSTGERLLAQGWLENVSDDSRRALVSGRLVNEAGEECTSSQGEFAVFTLEKASRLKILDETLKSELERRFERAGSPASP